MTVDRSEFDPIEQAVEEIRAGKIVIVVDDADRENEGDLIMAAEAATPDKIAFFLGHTSGVICMPMTGDRLDAPDQTRPAFVLGIGSAIDARYRAGLRAITAEHILQRGGNLAQSRPCPRRFPFRSRPAWRVS